MYPWSIDFRGRFEEHIFESQVLRHNPLGDPFQRPLWVYLPPGYDEAFDLRYPTLYLIQGLVGQIDMWRNRLPFQKTIPERADELFASGEAPPCLVVFVDCWTSLGGSQYLDSPATGRYHTYLCDEIVPWVDAHYRTLPKRDHRGIAGESSGGYGAMVTPMLRPDLWGGFATHAGDALFEVAYLPNFAKSVRALRDEYHGSFEAFWQDFRSRRAFSRQSDSWLLNDYCMAACYSADEDGAIHLPYDVATGELKADIWARWLAWDPVRMVPAHAEALRAMRAIYIDAGKRDDFFLDLSAEAFRRALERIGVTDVSFELCDASHFEIEHRYPLSVKYLAARLSPATRS